MKLKPGRVVVKLDSVSGKKPGQPLVVDLVRLESRIKELLRQIPDSEDPMEIQDEIIRMGADAFHIIRKIRDSPDEPGLLLNADDVYERFLLESLRGHAESGDVDAFVREIIDVYTDFTRMLNEPEAFNAELRGLGAKAVDSLISAAYNDNPILADCALLLLSGLTREIAGDPALLKALPLIQHNLRAISANANSADSAPKPPTFENLSHSLTILSRLNRQFPGNGAIRDTVALLLGGEYTKDPIINRGIIETMKEMGVFYPNLSKGDKIKN